jgi:ubiquinone/menaquinone biosynthesis C-methylase UbiE
MESARTRPLQGRNGVGGRIRRAAIEQAYFAQHRAAVRIGLPLHLVSHLFERTGDPPPIEMVRKVQAMHRELLEEDLEDALSGLVPLKLLFDWSHVMRPTRWPGLVSDLFAVRGRRKGKEWKVEVDDETLRRFPAYYRRQYHWQGGGYLTDASARRYDLGVELLFLGAADVMRRRVLPPVLDAMDRARAQGRTQPRVLDVACGTGRTLGMLATARPDGAYTGVDLSPAYIREARRNLVHVDTLSLLVHDGRSLPFPDDSFDVVTSTYLFHELPDSGREAVLQELYRVCAPGGRVVIEDSALEHDLRGVERILHAFADNLHEPFYEHYLTDPLEDRIERVGFTRVRSRPVFVSKRVVADKPDVRASTLPA